MRLEQKSQAKLIGEIYGAILECVPENVFGFESSRIVSRLGFHGMPEQLANDSLDFLCRLRALERRGEILYRGEKYAACLARWKIK